MAGCEWNDVGCWTGDWAKDALGGAIEDMAQAVMGAVTNTIASLGTMWVNIGTPNLTGTGGGSSITAGSSAPDSGNITTVLGYVTWIGLGIAVLSLFILGALIASRMRAGEGIAAVGKIGLLLASVVLISSASALIAGLMPSGPSNASGAVLFLQSGLWWYMGAAAVVSVIIGGARMAWEQRAEPGRDTVKGLLTLVIVAGAGTTMVGLLVAAADSFSTWILNASLDCDVSTPGSACFETNLTTMLALTSSSGAGLGPLLIIILGLIAVLSSAFQIVLMVARGGMLVILTGILPLSASFTNTEMGKNWFRKCIGWLIAFILYKPAAAIVYATAFQLVGTNVFSDDGTGLLAILTGLMLMLIALFALPALMRFVTPMVGAMAGGAGGALTLGALAALPSGAAALGRLGSGNSGSSSTQASNNGGDGPTGPSGPTGGDGGGNNAAQGGQSTGPQGGSSHGGGSTSTNSTAGTSTASSGGSIGAASSGGGGGAGAAAGGGAAAGVGAAAGPVGIAAGVALQAGRKAGQAAQSLGEDATGEGGGPDGSR